MDGIRMVISQVQKRVQGNPVNRGVTMTLRTLEDIGLYRAPARIPNISKHISSQTTDKYLVYLTA